MTHSLGDVLTHPPSRLYSQRLPTSATTWSHAVSTSGEYSLGGWLPAPTRRGHTLFPLRTKPNLQKKTVQSFVLSDQGHERIGSKQICLQSIVAGRFALQNPHGKSFWIAVLRTENFPPLVGEHVDRRSDGSLHLNPKSKTHISGEACSKYANPWESYISRGSLQMYGALNTPSCNLSRNFVKEAQEWARRCLQTFGC